MFSLTRTNRRKTTLSRRTQVIDVPKFIMRTGLPEMLREAAYDAEASKTQHLHPKLFIPNPNKFAGKKKFIFHVRPNAW